ncbi:hypothetical protein KP509_26G037700 [Ceratopteris richardii]|uniref:Glycosyltransferase n=1 Tax=Ceratopteris richardii TaxID=49495 RepID=A0A8T2RK42_CERRI|nr:hypothetical protein KP509_26G037700 [Ceratopteris richardii]
MEDLHFALFPFPEQGHIAPMYQLALHLVSRGAHVTFINTETGHQRPRQLLDPPNQHNTLKHLCITDGISTQRRASLRHDVIVSDANGVADLSYSSMPILLRSLEGQASFLEELLDDLKGSRDYPPLSCLIIDAFMPWTAAISQKLQLPWIVFWTTSATRLHYTVQTLEPNDLEQLKEMENIPTLTSASLPVFDLLKLQNPDRRQLLVERVEAMKKAHSILLNTFDALEEEAIKGLQTKLPVMSLGPFCIGAGGNTEALDADDECMPWLDRQTSGSVLYISFGSKLILQKDALEQLALGVESSEVTFLWTIRGGVEDLPEGFLERTKGRSKVMPWVSQGKVLKHRAIGAFLTHCGWNSIIEAIVGGVPMICLPFFADQPTNKILVESKWRIGRGIEGSKIAAECIRQAIQDVMSNSNFKREASLLSSLASSAMSPEGSSYQNLNFLLEKFCNHGTK